MERLENCPKKVLRGSGWRVLDLHRGNLRRVSIVAQRLQGADIRIRRRDKAETNLDEQLLGYDGNVLECRVISCRRSRYQRLYCIVQD